MISLKISTTGADMRFLYFKAFCREGTTARLSGRRKKDFGGPWDPWEAVKVIRMPKQKETIARGGHWFLVYYEEQCNLVHCD